MNLLALLLGLGIERLLTNVLHLREFHWLDPLFDRYFARMNDSGAVISVLAGLLVVLLVVLPVVVVYVLLLNRFALIPEFVFSVFVLLFCLGPRDLVKEVDAYKAAIEKDDEDELEVLACELLERPIEPDEVVPDIEQAVFIQANNRIFGVVFWFAVLGPAGAWLFRVFDLMRRRALQHHGQSHDLAAPVGEDNQPQPMVRAILTLHRVFAWVPSRLLMAGYAMAGNYDSALQAWRDKPPASGKLVPGPDAELLGLVGCAATARADESNVAARADTAISLVLRTLWFIWCPVLALLTIYGALA